ncbi:MAG: hypothetical protein PVF62_17105, partial [Desulfobacterales bacterium]
KGTEDNVRGCKINPKLLADIAKYVSADVRPRTSWRAAKEFRLQIITTLAQRVVEQAILNAGGTLQ